MTSTRRSRRERQSLADLFDAENSLAQNIIKAIDECFCFEGNEDYKNLVTAYLLIPSACLDRVPYLFIYGESGSGKSTLQGLISRVTGYTILGSASTYAGIRNHIEAQRDELRKKKSSNSDDENEPILILDDISEDGMMSNNLYSMFKSSYDRDCSHIAVSGEKTGTNENFNPFCMKVFSASSPYIFIPKFKELKRRSLVLTLRKLLSDNRPKYEVAYVNWEPFKNAYQQLINSSDYLDRFDEGLDKARNLSSSLDFASRDVCNPMVASLMVNLGFSDEQAQLLIEKAWLDSNKFVDPIDEVLKGCFKNVDQIPVKHIGDMLRDDFDENISIPELIRRMGEKGYVPIGSGKSTKFKKA